MAVNAVSGMVTGYVQAAVASQKLASSLEFSAGSARGAAQEIEYLRRVSRDMGLDFGTASGAYAKFAASARSAGMSLGDTHKIFEGISKAGARFGLSSEEMSGAFLALGQMASKGVVSMEELRGQLGERLPGAFDLAAKAMGVTQVELIKLVESGKLAASDFLPKFGQALNDNITVPMGTLQQSINNASTSWELWKRALAEGAGGGSLGWLTNGLNESAAAMRLLGNEAGIVHKLFVAIGAFQAGAVTKGMGFDIALAQEKGRDRARELWEYIAPLQAQLDKIGYLTPMQHEALRTAKRDLDDINTELAKLALRSGREAGIKLPNLKEQVEKQRSSEDARLKAYSDDTQFAPKAAKIAADIEKENKAFNAAVVGLQETDARYIAALKTHNERVAEIKAKAATKSAKAAVDEFAAVMNRINAKDSGVDAGFWKNLQTLHAGYQSGRVDADAYAAAVRNLTNQQGFAKDAAKAAADAEESIWKAREKAREEAERGLATLQGEIEQQQRHNEEIGLTAAGLADLADRRMQDAIATKEQEFAKRQAEGADLAELKLIDEQIGALEKLRQLKSDGAARQAVADAAKQSADEWKRFTDDIERALTDSLMRGFENGESFGKTFVKSLQNTLKTTVLKVAVQAVVGDVMGAVGLGSGGSGSGSSIGSALSMGSNLSSLAGGGSILSGFGAGFSSMAGEMAMGAKFVGPSAALARGSVGAGAATARAMGSTAAGMMSSVAAAAPYALAALAVADAVGLFGKGGGPQQGQYSQTTRDSFNVSHTSSGGAPLDSKALASAVLGQVDMLYSMAGRQKANVMIDQGYGFDPQGTSQDMKYRKINIDGRQLTSFDDRSVRGDSAGAAARLSHLTSKEIEAIAAAINDSKLNGIIETLKANFGDLAAAMEKYAVGQAKQQALLSLLQSDEEKQRDTTNSLFAAVGGAFNSLNVTMPDSVAGLHAFVAGLDLTTKSGADTLATLDALGPSLVSYIEAAKKVEADRRSWQEKLDVLNGTTTEKELERSRTLASTSDTATQALMRQVWATQDIADAAQVAAQAQQAAAARMLEIDTKRRDLSIQLLEAQGKTVEAEAEKRKDVLSALGDASLQDLQQQVWAALDAAKAQEAARQAAEAAQQAAQEQARAAQQAAEEAARAQQQIVDGWRRTADAIMATVRKLTGDLLGEEQGFARTQADYAIAIAAAKAGDQAAADKLPDMARALVDLGKTNSVTATDQALLTARTLASLKDVMAGIGSQFGIQIPAFAGGGMHMGGLRLVGENGPELEATGPSRIYNAAQTLQMLGGAGDLLSEVRALRAENAALRETIEVRLSRIEGNTLSTSRAVNGNPDAPILVEVAA